MAHPRPANHLAVVALLPCGQVGTFLRSVAGANDWFVPEGCMFPLRSTLQSLGHGDLFPAADASAHAQMAYRAFLMNAMGGKTRNRWADIRNQRLDLRWGNGLPNWLPVTDGCIVRMACDPDWPGKLASAAFSIPKLVPLDHGLFSTFYGHPGTWADGAVPNTYQGFFPALAQRLQSDLLGQTTPYTEVGKPSVHSLSHPDHCAVVFRFRSEAKPAHTLAIAQVALARALDRLGLPRHFGLVLSTNDQHKGEWSLRTGTGRTAESTLRGLFAVAPGHTLTGPYQTGSHDLGGALALMSHIPSHERQLLKECLSLARVG
jgi:hypothetical protein